MKTHVLDELRRLSAQEQLEVVEAIWNKIRERDTTPLPTDAQKAELDRRVADHEANPAEVLPWNDVKASALAHIER